MNVSAVRVQLKMCLVKILLQDYEEEAEEELEDENLRKLFLGGINRSMTKEDIEEHFGTLGTVVHVSVATDNQQNSKGRLCTNLMSLN